MFIIYVNNGSGEISLDQVKLAMHKDKALELRDQLEKDTETGWAECVELIGRKEEFLS